MMKQDQGLLVSVITAFLNEERFLPETVESVLRQKYTNWELILVDDGSTDGSTAMAKKYAASSNGKIIYTEHEGHVNKGLSASRNHGIALAKGSLLAFLDADDVWLPRKLELQVKIMDEHPEVAMICEASLYWHSWLDKYHKDIVMQVGHVQDKVYYPPELLEELYPLSEGYAPCPSAIMIRTLVAVKHGSFESHFSGKYQLYEDQGFLHKIYLNEPVFISSNCNNKYRQREGSLVQAIRFEGNYDSVRKYFLEWLQQYMQEHHFLNEKFEILIKKAFEKLDQRETPLITIITPFLNEERYLGETIESVLNQTYTHWEYLLVDDGSSDSSMQIAKEYESKYPGKIIYLQHDNHANKGVCASRNLGIEKANGGYIAFLDGDDLWLPEKLEKQVALLKEYPGAHMFCEATHYLNKGRNPRIENVDVQVGVPADQLYTPPSLIFKLYPLGIGDAPCMNSILIETALVRTIGGFDESFVGRNSLYEDQAFLFKVYFHAIVYVSSLCNNVYRQRPDSSMHKLLAAGNYKSGRKYFLKWLKSFLKDQYVQYPAVNALYKKSSLSYNYQRIYKLTFGNFFKLRAALNKTKK